MAGSMDCFGLTDIGRTRRTNEDQFLIADISKSMRIHQTSLTLDHQTRLFGETQGKLMLVADGMGGHEAGERASQLVIDEIVNFTLNKLNWYRHNAPEGRTEFESDLKEGLLACQNRILLEVDAIPSRRGMGSTLTMAYIVWPTLFIVHVGDSRCYLLRDHKLQQLTTDHTIAELSFGSRELAEDEIESDRPFANVLWNVIGGGDVPPNPDALAVELQFGDVILLCTDGLTKHVSPKRIREVLSQDLTVVNQCKMLVEESNREGGTDNVTVVVSRFSRNVDSGSDQSVAFEIDMTEEETSELDDTGEFAITQQSATSGSSTPERAT